MYMKVEHLTANQIFGLVRPRDSLGLPVRMWSSRFNAGKWCEKAAIGAARAEEHP
jgi:hypothetical protein